jgi:hypothetical protein
MQGLRTVLVALLLASYWMASALPCEPALARMDAADAAASEPLSSGHHDHHGAASGGAGAKGDVAEHAHHAKSVAVASASDSAEDAMPCHASPNLQARCDCGCDAREGTTTPGARLGVTLPSTAVQVGKAPAHRPLTLFLAQYRSHPTTGRDPIPI